MKIIFQYIDKKTQQNKNYVIFKKKEKNNIYKLQQLDFYAQIC